MPSSLPLPVSAAGRLRASRHRFRVRLSSLSASLFARARTTNLAVLILSSICSLSLYFNLRSIWWSSTSFTISQSGFPHSDTSFPSFRTHPVPPSYSQFTRLVIVPGHAIYIGADPLLHDPLDPKEWILESYQARHPPSSIGAFIHHIRTAIHTVSNDPSALLIYSGGQTRHQANQSTEAASYSRLANQMGLHDKLSWMPPQTTTEEFALDSWTNLIYSVARFKEYTGHYPKQITVVGHSIKAKRFIELHRKAMQWPADGFQYIGLDPINLSELTTSASSAQEVQELQEIESSMIAGERQVYLEFEKDLYGCNSHLLDKRKSRNSFRRFHPYLTSNPEIRGLLDWCPTNGIDEYTDPLPWA